MSSSGPLAHSFFRFDIPCCRAPANIGVTSSEDKWPRDTGRILQINPVNNRIDMARQHRSTIIKNCDHPFSLDNKRSRAASGVVRCFYLFFTRTVAISHCGYLYGPQHECRSLNRICAARGLLFHYWLFFSISVVFQLLNICIYRYLEIHNKTFLYGKTQPDIQKMYGFHENQRTKQQKMFRCLMLCSSKDSLFRVRESLQKFEFLLVIPKFEC